MKNNLYNINYNRVLPSLQLDYKIDCNEFISENDISITLHKIIERIDVSKYIDLSVKHKTYDPITIFEVILLSYVKKPNCSLREMEENCKKDVDFIYLTGGRMPTHQTFKRFFDDSLKGNINDIFYEINKLIEKDLCIDTDNLYIDGTKIEANANKRTFVWMKGTRKNREKCWKSTEEEIKELNIYFKEESIDKDFSLLKPMDVMYLYCEIMEFLKELIDDKKIKIVYGKGRKKHRLQKFYEKFGEYAKRMFTYQMHEDIAGERNSFSKTDPDATFMHMKYDYYNHTNVFKPGYNIQMGICDEFIRHIYVSSDANDIKTYIPFMEEYYKIYGAYPKRTPADAGYGSYDNYMYCKDHNIELYMKFNTYEKEKKKVTDKNRFKNYNITEKDGEYFCPEGFRFKEVNRYINIKGIYPKENIQYKNNNCQSCPSRSKCTSSKYSQRTLYVSPEYNKQKREVQKNLSTEDGLNYMKKRSSQAEGVFGIIKEDYGYDRLHRRGKSNVETEIFLVGIAFNIRKYHQKTVMDKRKSDKPRS